MSTVFSEAYFCFSTTTLFILNCDSWMFLIGKSISGKTHQEEVYIRFALRLKDTRLHLFGFSAFNLHSYRFLKEAYYLSKSKATGSTTVLIRYSSDLFLSLFLELGERSKKIFRSKRLV